jgi:hypothetical protein
VNNVRTPYLVVCQLPYDVTVKFGKAGAPEECDLKPQFRRLGSEDCLSRALTVQKRTPKQATIRLPESLACLGPGRYEMILHDRCCQVCDTVEIWFEAECEIVSIEGQEIEEICDDC